MIKNEEVMRWKSFENELPQDGEHILILTRGCSSSAAEAFFIKPESVKKFYKDGLLSDEEYIRIKEIDYDLKMAEGYGHNVTYPKYYVIAPVFSGNSDEVWLDERCQNFKWIEFPEE